MANTGCDQQDIIAMHEQHILMYASIDPLVALESSIAKHFMKSPRALLELKGPQAARWDIIW